jgi:hydroxymethylpyrimidine kinase/phosphomethylpyrimidine kinase
VAAPPIALTIAASDPLGGAGLQADLTTFAHRGVHGVSAVTAVTAQTLDRVERVDLISPEMIEAQIRGILSDFEIAAVKTGLLARASVIELIADEVAAGRLPAPVVDPVMVDGRGRRLIDGSAEVAYREHLFPRALVITPNLAEASLLVGRPLTQVEDIAANAAGLRGLGADVVVVTGGAFEGDPQDVCVTADAIWSSKHPRVDTTNVRGSGCTFAAAITAELAHGFDVLEAIGLAGEFVRDAIADSATWPLGPGGPVSHRVDWDWVD